MEIWSYLVLPFVLILGRVGAFMLSAPVFSSSSVPAVVKVGLLLMLTISFALFVPGGLVTPPTDWMRASVLVLQEVTIGLALGLAARLLYTTVQQAGVVLSQQMGLTDAEMIDPISGEESESLSSFMETTFALLFLAGGGHLLLLSALAGSYKAFPIAATPDIGTLASAIVTAGATMMTLALKLAAPALAAFLALSMVFALLSRVLPDLNLLIESYPLRIALGLLIASVMLPVINGFTVELADWMNKAFG